MKIVILSPSRDHLRSMGAALETSGHAVVCAEGGKSRMRRLAEQEDPQLMLVDGMCCDSGELAHVEEVATHHPAVAVILLCAMHTPEFLINSMRAGVREVLPSPPSPAALEAAVDRIAAKLAPRGARTGKIVAFMPAKGGSGATFVATNLAWQLAQSRSVLLIDLNLQFGDALSFVHDGKPASTLADVAREIARLDASLLASSAVKVAPNFSILAAPEDLADTMEVKPEHIEPLLKVAAAQYEFVLLDVSRTLDPLAIKALDRAHRIYAVLQGALPHVRHAAKLLEVFRSLGYPPEKTELILNRHERSSEIGVEQVRRSLGAVAIHTVPNSFKEVNAAINHGDPLARTARSNAVVRQLVELAAHLNPRAPDDGRGILDRILRRA